MKLAGVIREFVSLRIKRLQHRPIANPVGMHGAGVTREHVMWAYRVFLDREPESETAILAKLNAWRTTKELRADFMTSLEFRRENPDFAAANERNIVIKEFDDQLRLFIDLSDHVIGLNILRERYERSEIDLVRKFVKPGHVVLDIGAHIGLFTITMASLVGPSGRVYAFEPFDDLADLLQRSIAENRFEDRVTLVRIAIGHASGSSRLVFLRHSLNSGGSYLLDERVELPAGHEAKLVPLVSLDDYPLRRPIGFIKMDIEGSEPLAMRGAKKMLREDQPVILSEINPIQLERVSGCTPAEFISDMQGYGYDCHLLDGGKLAGKITRVDDTRLSSVVFLPKQDSAVTSAAKEIA